MSDSADHSGPGPAGAGGAGQRKVLLGGRLAQEVAQWLGSRHDGLLFRAKEGLDTITGDDLAWADVYVGFRPPTVGLAGMSWVHSGGAGVESFLAEGVLDPTATLTRTAGDMGHRIGEYCLGWIAAHCQHHRHFLKSQQEHKWSRRTADPIRGSTAVVVGTGTVGQGIARVMQPLGVNAVGVSLSGAQADSFASVHTTAALPELVSDADWVILAVPLTERTRGMMGPATLSACRGALLINVARGDVVDHSALLDALDHGRLSGAVLDVFPQEPLPADSPLWDRPDIVVTPHIAALTAVHEVGEAFLDALAALEAGKAPRLVVDRSRGY